MTNLPLAGWPEASSTETTKNSQAMNQEERWNLTTPSREWAVRRRDERYKDLGQLIAALEDRRERSAEHTGLFGRYRIEHDDRRELYLASDDHRWRFTNWSFGQMCIRAGAPQTFLVKLQPETAARVLNERLGTGYTTKFMTVRGKDGTSDFLQAITSPYYGRVWDADVAKAVQRIVDSDTRWHNPPAYDPLTRKTEPGGLYAGDRDMFIFMIDGGSEYDVGSRARLYRGFFVRNSEVGGARLELTTFLFNSVCGNHIIYGARNVESLIIRHNATGPDRYRNEFQPKLEAFAAQDPELDAIKRAQTRRLLSVPRVGHHNHLDDKWQHDFARAYGFTRREIEMAFETAANEEGKCDTVWDLVQGLTEVAREMPYQDQRLALEVRAAKLLEISNN